MPSWLWYSLAAAIAGSLSVVLAKVGLRESPEDMALFIRTGILFLAVTAISLYSGEMKKIGSIDKISWLALVGTGISTAVYWKFYYKALKVADAHYVAALDKAGVLFTVLLSVVLLKEQISAKVAFGIFLIIIGCVLIVTANKS